jgi:solute carrier family 24 (sodium/potassium/calcium exchanger), member 6
VLQAMLGVTVLAWANSFGDLVADSTMARDGFPAMGVAACFASPLFTMVAGLGVCFMITAAVRGDVAFALDAPMSIAMGFAFASVARFLVLLPCVYRWRLTRRSAWYMIAFYAAFQVAYLWAIARGR